MFSVYVCVCTSCTYGEKKTNQQIIWPPPPPPPPLIGYMTCLECFLVADVFPSSFFFCQDNLILFDFCVIKQKNHRNPDLSLNFFFRCCCFCVSCFISFRVRIKIQNQICALSNNISLWWYGADGAFIFIKSNILIEKMVFLHLSNGTLLSIKFCYFIN